MKKENNLLKIAQSISGKSTNEIIEQKNIIKNYKNKGHIGNIIQEYLFNIKPNSSKEPDFTELGIDMELKVTTVKKLKRGKDNYSAKERLSISQINYAELNENFYESHVYKKIKKMLIMTYLYEANVNLYDYKFINSYIFNFDQIKPSEKETIINDYNLIYNKVKTGEAHEISSKDTKILEANRKGSGGAKEKKISQPNSEITAYRRAFSFKNSYMTLLFKRFYNKENYDFNTYIINGYVAIKNFLKTKIGHNLNDYDNKTSTAKNQNGNTLRKIIKEWNEEAFNLIKDKQIKLRSMILKDNNKIQESLPLSTNYIVKDEIIQELDFKNSRFYKELTTPYILVTIKNENDKRILDNVYLINSFLTNENLNNNAEKVWENTKSFFGELNKNPKYHETNKLISLKDTFDFHIRPKAKNGKSNYIGTNLTKQAFWINNKSLQKILDDYIESNINV